MTGGVVEGRRLSGRTFGAGADWMLVGADGFLRMDVRVQIRTGDGALLCARYRGLTKGNDMLRRAIASMKGTGFADQFIRTSWELESGDPRYAWVNQSVFVGEARFCPFGPAVAGIEHRVHRVG